jgi:hypothetical protein
MAEKTAVFKKALDFFALLPHTLFSFGFFDEKSRFISGVGDFVAYAGMTQAITGLVVTLK